MYNKYFTPYGSIIRGNLQDYSLHCEYKQVLLIEDHSQKHINDCLTFYVHSIIVIVNRNLNCKELLIKIIS